MDTLKKLVRAKKISLESLENEKLLTFQMIRMHQFLQVVILKKNCKIDFLGQKWLRKRQK